MLSWATISTPKDWGDSINDLIVFEDFHWVCRACQAKSASFKPQQIDLFFNNIFLGSTRFHCVESGDLLCFPPDCDFRLKVTHLPQRRRLKHRPQCVVDSRLPSDLVCLVEDFGVAELQVTCAFQKSINKLL